jgi:hypothetical protein
MLCPVCCLCRKNYKAKKTIKLVEMTSDTHLQREGREASPACCTWGT